MRRSIILSAHAYQTISDAVRQAGNKHEVGGVLLGHCRPNSYYVIDATVPTGEEKASYCSFEIDGERETEKANGIIDSYCIQPKPIGLWHSHLTKVETFSYQDRLTNRIFAEAYNDVASLIVLPDAHMDVKIIIPYSISPEGNESRSYIEFGDHKIPTEYLIKNDASYNLGRED